MITHWQSGETIVGHLRVEGARVDPTIAQLCLSSLLNSAVTHPTALPPAAIVFIRKLRDPLPRSLRIQQRDIRPPPAWQQALSATLNRLVVSAARPALGEVPAEAEAVVFLDRSELLACLASDWCEGQITTRWWWQSLLKQGAASQIVKELWRRAPEYVPAALDHLAKAVKATTFVKTFSGAEARALLSSVARSFSLNVLVSVLDTLSAPNAPSSPGETGANLSVAAAFTKRSSDIHPTADVSRGAPWAPWVRKSETSGLGPEQQSFLGISLMLQRAPTRVRVPGFAREVEAWQREIVIPRALPSNHFVGDKKKDEIGRPRPSVPEVSAADVSASSTVPLHPEANSVEEFSRESALPPPQRQLADSLAGKRGTTSLVEHWGTGGDIENSVIAMEAATDAPEQFPLIESQTATQFGGLFYLINLGLYLGLYGDFTTPAEPGIELSIWDFVALVGRELVGERIQEDPLWTLLARLSGRTESEEPGSGFKPKDEWRLPAEWLEPFSKESLVHWWTAEGRLRLLHAGGFLVLDVPLAAGNPAEQLQRLLKAYDGFEFRVLNLELAEDPELGSIEDLVLKESLETRNPRPATGSPLGLWLERLMPYLRVRLQRALGLNETEDPAPILCEQQGRVFLTATHLDLFFALDELPIEIRFAGLDRNPGWVPAAGRFIAFHFE